MEDGRVFYNEWIYFWRAWLFYNYFYFDLELIVSFLNDLSLYISHSIHKYTLYSYRFIMVYALYLWKHLKFNFENYENKIPPTTISTHFIAKNFILKKTQV